MAFKFIPRRRQDETDPTMIETRPRVVGQAQPPMPQQPTIEMMLPELIQPSTELQSNGVIQEPPTQLPMSTLTPQKAFQLIPRRTMESEQQPTSAVVDSPATRERYVGEKSLDDQILDDDAYLNDLRRQPIENRNSRGKGILRALGYGLQAFNRPIRDWSDFANAAGNTAAHGIYGLFDKKLDERLDNQREIAKTEQQRGFKFKQRREQQESAMADAQLNELKDKPSRERAKILADAGEVQFKPMGGRWYRVDKLGNMEPVMGSDGKQLTENEYIPVHNETTGQLVLVNKNDKSDVTRIENVVSTKPKTFSEKDIPRSRFGLPSDEDYKRQARANVSATYKARQLKPEVAQRYNNDLNAIWNDIEAQIIRPSDVWENTTERDNQALAQSENELRKQYADIEKIYQDFLLRVSNNQPKEGAGTVNIADLADVLDLILKEKDAKKRSAAYNALIQDLPNRRIQ